VIAWQGSHTEPGIRLLYVSHIERHGVDLFREVCRQDLEGIVAKWKYGAYVSSYETSWVKINNPAHSQAVGRWEKLQRRGISERIQAHSRTRI